MVGDDVRSERFEWPGRSWRRIPATVGPGLVVMLADTEVGSVISASQSGARWGYRLMALQFLLVPVLYATQELALRLGGTSGLAGVGQIFGIPSWATIGAIVAMIFIMVGTGSYHAVERFVLVLGAAELAFLVVAWRSHPDASRMLAQVSQQPLADHDYLYLLAANLGTCVMPWTVFYQQSAVIDKGLTESDLKLARLDTLLGALA